MIFSHNHELSPLVSFIYVLLYFRLSSFLSFFFLRAHAVSVYLTIRGNCTQHTTAAAAAADASSKRARETKGFLKIVSRPFPCVLILFSLTRHVVVRVLYRRELFSKRLASSPERPCSTFYAYRSRTPNHWSVVNVKTKKKKKNYKIK